MILQTIISTTGGGGGTATVTLTGRGVGAASWYKWEWINENGEIQQSNTMTQFTMLVPGTLHFTDEAAIRPDLVSGDATRCRSIVGSIAYAFVIRGDTTIELKVVEPLP